LKTNNRYIFLLCLLSVAVLIQAQEPAPATLLGRWTRDSLPASAQYGNAYNEVWGLALNGREYAVIGSTLGTHIIDVTRPQDAEEVAFIAGASAGPNLIHRDFHNYGCYLYAVSDEGRGSLQIIDVSGLPDRVEVVYDSPEFFERSHNIFIDTARAVLYACFARGGARPTTPLKLLDISDPLHPKELATYNNFGSGPVSHVHDCYVENGLAFLNLGFDGMAIVDFTDPLQPDFQNTLTDYPFAGYNHSGWPTADLQYYYLGDESHGFPLKILDVSDPSEIQVVETFDADSPNELSIPHNQLIACDYLYVSYYYDGLQVYDISDPASPRRVSYFGTSSLTHRKSYEGAWGVYPFLPSGNILVSDMQNGLFVLSGPDAECAQNDQLVLQCELLDPVKEAYGESFPVTIYPQPATAYLDILLQSDKSQEKVNARLLDIQGRTLQRWESDAISGKLRLSLPTGMASGMYLLQIRTAGRSVTRKIIIRQ
jgi:choice-of-anchor B domain-containing protein